MNRINFANSERHLIDWRIRIAAYEEMLTRNQRLAISALLLAAQVILGSEEHGISEELLATADEKCKIPLSGNIESLNVSVAAGVILFESVRQKNT